MYRVLRDQTVTNERMNERTEWTKWTNGTERIPPLPRQHCRLVGSHTQALHTSAPAALHEAQHSAGVSHTFLAPRDQGGAAHSLFTHTRRHVFDLNFKA